MFERLTTDDLELSPIQEHDLERVLEIRLANRDRLARTEGSDGEVGTYDLNRLERDVTVALADPARQFLVAREALNAPALRAAADDDDQAATGFLRHLGFMPIDRRRRIAPHGEVDVTVFEKLLRP